MILDIYLEAINNRRNPLPKKPKKSKRAWHRPSGIQFDQYIVNRWVCVGNNKQVTGKDFVRACEHKKDSSLKTAIMV